MKNRFLSICLGIGLILSLAACSKRIGQTSSGEYIRIFPLPPDTTRIQYLTSFSSSSDIKGKQGSFNKFLFGEDEPLPIIKPYGIASYGSKLYICDTGLGGIITIDLENNSFDYFIPGGKGQMQFPINCDLDNEGNLYVADGNRRQIVIFDKEGRYVSAIGDPEDFKPTDVKIFGDKIWVANILNHCVMVYSCVDFSLLYSFPEINPGKEGHLFQPSNIYLSEDNVYVSDFGDFKIKVYTHDGDFQRSVGGYGNSFGQFMRPKGLAADNESLLYVVDAAFENAQIFDNYGNILMFFGGTYRIPGDMWLPAGIAIDYDNIEYFQQYIDPDFEVKYLIYVTNQYGPGKIGVYGFVGPK